MPCIAAVPMVSNAVAGNAPATAASMAAASVEASVAKS